MGLHDVFDNGKTESRAAEFAAAGFVDAVKALENVRQMFRLRCRSHRRHGGFDDPILLRRRIVTWPPDGCT